MIINVKKIAFKDTRTGVSERGSWCYTTAVVEWDQQDAPTSAPYTQSMVVDIKGNIDQQKMLDAINKQGSVKMWVNMHASEYQEKWYNGIRGNVEEQFRKVATE